MYFFNDWNSNSNPNLNTYIDDSTDSQGVELLDFSICNDDDYLFIKIRCGSEIDLTEQFYNPSEIIINIDADNNVSTGFFVNNIGSEYGINFFDRFIFGFLILISLTLFFLRIRCYSTPTYSSDESESYCRALLSDTICVSIREKIGETCQIMDLFLVIFLTIVLPPITTSVNFKNDVNNLRLMTYNVLSNDLINSNRIESHRRIFESVNADIVTYQECGNTNYNDVLNFLNTILINYPYIYPDLNSGNLTISKYPSKQSWQVSDKIDELIDLPDSIYSTDILILNAHPPSL